MSIKNRVAVAVVWVLSLVGVAVWAQDSQSRIVTKDGKVLQALPEGAQVGNVITGENIGFKVNRDTRGQILGRMVVKVDGQWRDVTFDVGITR